MSAGLPDFVVVNLDDLEKHFNAGEDVTLAAVKEKVKSISGRDASLPLKVSVLGLGTKGLTGGGPCTTQASGCEPLGAGQATLGSRDMHTGISSFEDLVKQGSCSHRALIRCIVASGAGHWQPEQVAERARHRFLGVCQGCH